MGKKMVKLTQINKIDNDNDKCVNFIDLKIVFKLTTSKNLKTICLYLPIINII